MPDNDLKPPESTDPEDRLVEAEVLKHTSVQGHLMIAGTKHMLPLWRAKKMREAGTVRPVQKAVPSHPLPPPPPPPKFDGEEDEPENEEAKPKAVPSTSRKREGGE